MRKRTPLVVLPPLLSALLAGCALQPAPGDVPAISPPPTDLPEPDDPSALPEVVDALPYHHSGSRLTAIAYEGPEGLPYLDAFWDSVLNMRCDFVQTEGGTWHCLPENDGLYAAWTDDACTSLIAEGIGASFTRQTMWVSTDGSCGEGYFAPVELGAPIDLTSDTLYYPADGACEAVSGTNALGGEWEVSILDLDLFVEGTLHVSQIEEAYAQVLIGDDGSKTTVGPALRSGERCFRRDTDAGYRCLPVTRANVSATAHYGDEACTQPLAVRTNASCDVRWAADTDASDHFTIHEVLDGVDPAETFAEIGGTCVADSFESTYIAGLGAPVTIGPPIRTDAWFVLGSETKWTDSLSLGWATTADGTPIAPDDHRMRYDYEPCSVGLLDGTAVCVPDGWTFDRAQRYSDLNCTQPLASEPDEIMADWAVPHERVDLNGVYIGADEYTGIRYRFSPAGICTVTQQPAYELVPHTLQEVVPLDL